MSVERLSRVRTGVPGATVDPPALHPRGCVEAPPISDLNASRSISQTLNKRQNQNLHLLKANVLEQACLLHIELEVYWYYPLSSLYPPNLSSSLAPALRKRRTVLREQAVHDRPERQTAAEKKSPLQAEKCLVLWCFGRTTVYLRAQAVNG